VVLLLLWCRKDGKHLFLFLISSAAKRGKEEEGRIGLAFSGSDCNAKEEDSVAAGAVLTQREGGRGG